MSQLTKTKAIRQ